MNRLHRLLIFLLASALAGFLLLHWRQHHLSHSHPTSPSPTTSSYSTSSSSSIPSPLYAELTSILERATSQPGLTSAALGFCLLDAQGDIALEHHARTAFIPASSLKTVTTATALEKLGPDFRFATRVDATASLAEGVVQGDLIIRGGADPMLALSDLQAWAQDLKTRGLQRITGRIIGDGSLLPGTLYDDFWNWGDIGNGYGSAVSGLNLQHNRYEAVFDAGPAEGLPVRWIGAKPEVPGVQFFSEVLTGPAGSGDGVVIHGGERTSLIHLRGTVPLGVEGFTVAGAVPDPERFAAHHLRAALLAAGITVEGEAVSAMSIKQAGQSLQESAATLFTHDSPPLLDIITSIHDTSDNHETECVYRFLGVREKKAPDEVVRQHWRARGLEFEALRMEDGCGLARADFIRPLDLARLQHLVARGPHGKAYQHSLLSKDDGAYRWKGGAMSGIRSTTGYVLTASGETFSFAFIVNHHTDSTAVTTLREELISAMRRL